jgi:hypothetical protein
MRFACVRVQTFPQHPSHTTHLPNAIACNSVGRACRITPLGRLCGWRRVDMRTARGATELGWDASKMTEESKEAVEVLQRAHLPTGTYVQGRGRRRDVAHGQESVFSRA